jgi:hypothetical protein
MARLLPATTPGTHQPTRHDGGRAYLRKMTMCSAMMQQLVNLRPVIAAGKW